MNKFLSAYLIRSIVILAVITLATLSVHATEKPRDRAKVTELWEPVPPVVSTSGVSDAPSDAIVLFDGSNLAEWESLDGSEAKWRVEDGAVTVVGKTGHIRTKRNFSDIQLHIEWRTPQEVSGTGQGRGNSGVILMERYEVQVLDSFNNPTYSNGQAASIYKQHIPLVNASKGPGQWQTYDIIFMAPQFGQQGRVTRPATVTVIHNGVLVQNHVTIQGTAVFIGQPNYSSHGAAPLQLQYHGSPVSYRNIWVREL